jgi:hypothetical protein
MRSTCTPYSARSVENRARAERCGFDPGAVEFWGRGGEREAEHEARQARIREHAAVAVVPIEREQSRGSRGDILGRRGEQRVGRVAVSEALRRDLLDEPLEDVADGALASLEPVHAGQDRFGRDAAEAGNAGQ